MKDERGIYYLPSPANPQARMYVREADGQLQFRMFAVGNPEVWDKHEWLPVDVIKAAAEMYRQRGTDRNPMALYDEDVARRLLKDEG